MARKLNLDSGEKLSFEEVARELQRRLYRKGEEPNPYDDHLGCVLTLTYSELRSLSQRKKFVERFYVEVRRWGWELGILIAFGCKVVVVATDSHFAPDRLRS